MTDPSTILKEGDVLRLQVSPQYATIKIIPNNSSEASDVNFPHNLHNAVELFLKLGMVPQAVNLKDRVDIMLERYKSNPDGKSGVRLGQACVCWHCGACGIPKDYAEQLGTHDHQQSSSSSSSLPPPGPCYQCNETNQINGIRVTTPEAGQFWPWIEEAAMTEDQAKELKVKKEKELIERRKAVEASVAAALAERDNTVVHQK